MSPTGVMRCLVAATMLAGPVTGCRQPAPVEEAVAEPGAIERLPSLEATSPGAPRHDGADAALPAPADPPVSLGVEARPPGEPVEAENASPTDADAGAPAAVPAPASVYSSRDGEWTMWGGDPSRNMVNHREKGIPTSWDLKTRRNIKWMAALGSQSYGNPVVTGGKVLVGTNNQAEKNPRITGDKGIVMCFQATDGKFLWQAVHDKLESRVQDWPEQGICSTGVVEDGKYYYVSNRAELVCADLDGFLDGENDGPFTQEKYSDPVDGDFIWVLDMIEDLGVFPHNLATSSPLIANDLIYVHTSNGVGKDHITIPNPRAPSFIAVDKRTGVLVWKSAAPGENILCGQWSSPTYSTAGGKPQVIFPGGDGWVRAFEPLTGEIIWEFDCNPRDAVHDLGGKGTRNELVATAVAAGDRVYIGVGQDPEHGEGPGHFYSIDATRTGDVTGPGRVWHVGDKDFRRTISTCAVKDGLVYAVDLSGFLQCLDQETGASYWTHDMLAAVWGSPMWIDGHVYLGDEDGDVAVLKAGKQLEVVSEINMDNSVYSTPVASGGVLYLANRTHLFAIEREKN